MVRTQTMSEWDDSTISEKKVAKSRAVQIFDCILR